MLKKLFIKYVIGECRHICKLCSYRMECDVNYEEQTWKQLWQYYKHSKYVNRTRPWVYRIIHKNEKTCTSKIIF